MLSALSGHQLFEEFLVRTIGEGLGRYFATEEIKETYNFLMNNAQFTGDMKDCRECDRAAGFILFIYVLLDGSKVRHDLELASELYVLTMNSPEASSSRLLLSVLKDPDDEVKRFWVKVIAVKDELYGR
jgi:hypothetical protein